MVDAPAGVQSVSRAVSVLDAIADLGGQAALSDIAEVLGLPAPTVHRILRTLVEVDYVRQLSTKQYALGPALVHLGDRASRLLSTWATPILASLEAKVHETANLAVLSGSMIAYVAQVPSRHQMRMFTEVGRRVYPHSTGVGKAILSTLGEDQVLSIVRQNGFPAFTTATIADEATLKVELAHARTVGFAVDEGEQEVGVRCVAVPVVGPPSPMAVSVSGPAARLGLTDASNVIESLLTAALELGVELSASKTTG